MDRRVDPVLAPAPAPEPAPPLEPFRESAALSLGVELELGVWVDDSRPGAAGLRSDLYGAIWDAFKANGVRMPPPKHGISGDDRPETPATSQSPA